MEYRPESDELAMASGENKPVADASDFGEGYEYLWHLHGCYDYHQMPTDDRSMPKDDLVKAWLGSAVGHRQRDYTPESDTLKKLVYGPEGQIRYIFDTSACSATHGFPTRFAAPRPSRPAAERCS